MKTLNLSFKGSLGKGHTLKLNYVHDDLSEETVRQAMNKLAQSKLFQKDDELVFQLPRSAKYVTTTDQVIFTNK